MSNMTKLERDISGFFSQKSPEYNELVNTKRLMEKNKLVAQHFKDIKTNWKEKIDEEWVVEVMRCQFRDLLEKTKWELKCNQTFLDLGSAPGGFTSVLLSMGLRGTAITLEDGYKMQIQPSQDLNIIYDDFVEKWMDLNDVDLFVVDANPLKHNGNKMLYTEMKYMYQYLKQGGNCIFKLSCKPSPLGLSIVLLCSQLFKSFQLVKPIKCQSYRGTFYLCGREFKKELIDEFPLSGEESENICESRLNMSVSKTHELLQKILTPIWRIQTGALKKKYNKIINASKNNKKKY